MKTTKRIFKPLFSIMLALLLAFSSMAVVFAAEGADDGNLNTPPFTITIKNAEGLPNMSDGQFVAYQVFKGVVYVNPDAKPVEPGEGFDNAWNQYSLADIEWGANIKTAGLIEALKNAGTQKEGETEEPVLAPFKDIDESTTTAADIANILVKNASTEFLQAFCAFLKGDGILSSSNCWLKNGVGEDSKYPVKSKATAGLSAKEDVSEITVEDGGYYLIIEDYVPEFEAPSDHEHTGVVTSEYILAVLGDQEINIKASIPKLDKSIIEPSSENPNSYTEYNGAVYGIGDKVKFRLKGTLPENFNDYDWYYYKFVDTLSKGLTVDENSFKIFIDVPGEKEPREITLGSVKSANWDEITGEATRGDFPQKSVKPNEDGSTHIVIDMGDLKLGYAEGITPYSIIRVEYEATVNSDAVIGVPGNPNTSHLEFSNNPNDESSQGKTPDDTVWVYTFDLDLIKVDKDTPDVLQLEGAEFYLTKTVVEGEVEKTYYYHYDKTGDKVNVKWLSENEGEGVDPVPPEATKMVTDSNGKLTTPIMGLDSGVEYTLTEVKAPNGYNTIDPFTFKFTATVDANGMLTNIDVEDVPSRPETDDSIKWEVGKTTSTEGSEPTATGHITVTVKDPKAPFLPFTGGVGRTLIFVGGGVLFVGAVVALVLMSTKGRKRNQDA